MFHQIILVCTFRDVFFRFKSFIRTTTTRKDKTKHYHKTQKSKNRNLQKKAHFLQIFSKQKSKLKKINLNNTQTKKSFKTFKKEKRFASSNSKPITSFCSDKKK